MLIFSLWFSLMSPINNLLLCFSPASFSGSSLSLESVQIFYRICSANLSSKSFTIVLMEDSYRHSNALVFAGLVYCSSLNVETLWYFKKTTLANVMLTFSLWCLMMSPINYVLLCFARASYFVQVSVMKMFKSSIEYALQNSVSIHSLLFRWKSPISAALLCFPLAFYIVQVSKLKLFESFGRLHLQMWCWIFSLWFSMMSRTNNVLLCFDRASFFVQVSVLKMFKSSIEFALQNSVSIHSLLFRWKSPISAALLWFSLASYIVQVSILKVFESFGRLHLQIWCWNFLCGSHWCLL